jgi:hypothetical protein
LDDHDELPNGIAVASNHNDEPSFNIVEYHETRNQTVNDNSSIDNQFVCNIAIGATGSHKIIASALSSSFAFPCVNSSS